MPPKINIVGNTYGLLTVIESLGAGIKSTHQRVICTCSCGGMIETRASSLISGRTKSCGCLNTGPQTRLGQGGAALNKLFGRYERDAKNRGYAFLLSLEFFQNITKQNCYYCGAEPKSRITCGVNNGAYVYNGIDRSDNTLGYEPNNVVPCCPLCNRMKMKSSTTSFVQQVCNIYNHLNKGN